MSGPSCRFGVMIDSSPQDGPALADAAAHAEALGFDFVSVHPDHPSAAGTRGSGPTLEAWTAITWIAASTRRVLIAPCIISLPYRRVPVVAKMAETLDRLSGGRFVLALGAGGDDDATSAFGIPTRSPADKVAFLDEAITVVEGLWRTSRLTFAGTHVMVDGAVINPRPTRPIPIWLGVEGDRMLQLAGRRADGWWPSYFALPPPRAYRAIARLRSAAVQHDRDPADIACVYNVTVLVDERECSDPVRVAGGPEKVAHTLAAFVDRGFTWLNLWPTGHHTQQRERLASEVLPLVRDIVR